MVPHPTPRDDPGNHGPPAYHPAMLLALDIGNTNVTVGLFRAGALLATRLDTAELSSDEEEPEQSPDTVGVDESALTLTCRGSLT